MFFLSCHESGRITKRSILLANTYLATNSPNFFPHQAREYVLKEWEVDVCFNDFEFGIAGMEGEGCGVRFAGFDCASKKIKGEEFHGYF